MKTGCGTDGSICGTRWSGLGRALKKVISKCGQQRREVRRHGKYDYSITGPCYPHCAKHGRYCSPPELVAWCPLKIAKKLIFAKNVNKMWGMQICCAGDLQRGLRSFAESPLHWMLHTSGQNLAAEISMLQLPARFRADCWSRNFLSCFKFKYAFRTLLQRRYNIFILLCRVVM